jgi:transposase
MILENIGVENVYIACGYTDMRKSIDGLAILVTQVFQLDPFSRSIYLFCGRRSDRMKALHWEGDGFVLLYKRLERGRFQWPGHEREARTITSRQLRWLMEQMRLSKHRQYGASSENSSYGQLSLFNETEATADANVAEPEFVEVERHYRKRRRESKL